MLRAGIALLFTGPLVALTPVFTPPPNGCPPCPGFPSVSTPFVNLGIIVGAMGAALAIYGGIQERTIALKEGPAMQRGSETIGIALVGIALLVASAALSGIDLTGPGWSIVLYQEQGFYLGTLGGGTLFFVGFASLSKRRLSALFTSVGVVLCAISLLFSYTLSSDFATRCFPDVGCSPILANSTVTDMIDLGYLLAVGAFFVALGLSAWFLDRRAAKSKSRTSAT